MTAVSDLHRQRVLSGRRLVTPCPLGAYEFLEPHDTTLASQPPQTEASASTPLAPPTPRTKAMDESDTPFFPLMDLPPEIRELVWVMALPDRRVLHVDKTKRDPSSPTGDHQLLFHNRPPAPAVAQVCTEARAAAFRAGCLVFSQPGAGPGVWFNPALDIVYFDRANRSVFDMAQTSSRFGKVPGLAAARHVGMEWRMLLRNGTRLLEEYAGMDMRRHWTETLAGLRGHMPRVERVHYVLPMVRHKGGYPWGREPGPYKGLPVEIVPLPDGTVIPIESGHRSWEQVRRELGRAFEGADERAPGIEGWWLVRRGAPLEFPEDSPVKVFNY